MQKTDDIIVVGAGIIGISAALELQRRGRRVLVMDPAGIAKGASTGNAGAFAFSDILPLATPRIMRKAPWWLLDPLGPLSIPPSYAFRIAPWLLKFWRASLPDRFAQGVEAQASLMRLAQAAHERQLARVNGDAMMMRNGQLQLYDSKKSFVASLPDWELRRQHGIAFKLIESSDAIAEIQPGLNDRFRYAVFTPAWMNTVNPLSWAEHLADVFLAQGGNVLKEEARTIECTGERVSITTSAGSLDARQVVVAAGAHSHLLTRTLGDNIPLETERGYNTTLPSVEFDLKTQLTFADHGFVVSKIDDGLRVGGAVELGGLKMPPNYRRAERLLSRASEFLPGLNTTQGTQWMGFRPSLPDSLPVIGHARKSRNVIYAFGHGHLGLTQAAGTAEIVADLVTDNDPGIPMDAFSPTRF